MHVLTILHNAASMVNMSTLTNPYTEVDENLAHVRAQLLSDVSAALGCLSRAAAHLDALQAVDHEFSSGRDGRDINSHLDNAIRSGRAAYAVTHMIIEKERP